MYRTLKHSKIKFFVTLVIYLFFLNLSFADEVTKNSIEITANKNMEWDQQENKIVAQGDAQVKTNNFIISANIITGLYNGKLGKGNIKNLIASENAKFSSEETIIKASKIDYDFINDIINVKGQNIEMTFKKGSISSEKSLIFYNQDNKILVEGNVYIKMNNEGNIKAKNVTVNIDEKGGISLVKAINDVEIFIGTLEQKVYSDEAIFDNKASKINLMGNVVLFYGQSFLKGDKAFIDLENGVSRISSDDRTNVSGLFIK